MPLNVLATVSLHHRSGRVEDDVVNTFSFRRVGAAAEVSVPAVFGALDRFYTVAGSGTVVPIGALIGHSIDRTIPPTLRLYDLDTHLNGQPHGSPFFTSPMSNLPAATSGSQSLPSEVAICLSFMSTDSAALVPEFGTGTRPKSRHRGRIYVGPLITNVLENNPAEGFAQVNDTGLQAILQSAIDLRDDAPTEWSVWSRVDGTLYDVERVSVDRAFDSQRRRGERPQVTVSDTAAET